MGCLCFEGGSRIVVLRDLNFLLYVFFRCLGFFYENVVLINNDVKGAYVGIIFGDFYILNIIVVLCN